MRKVLRYLRIAFSATCGILCLLLIALWVRSYWCHYIVSYQPGSSTSFNVINADGLTVFVVMGNSSNWKIDAAVGDWTLRSRPPPDWNSGIMRPSLLRRVFTGFTWHGLESWHVPNWFLVLASATLAVAPWFRWRFSLRTLFIAMTLVAMLLGVIVVLLR
jgi:hypothetical protein